MTDCLREPALFVGDIDGDINLSMPPASGEEYIKRVVIEAQQYEDVVVAEIDKTRLKSPTIAVKPLGGCIEAPASLCPSLEWQQCQVADFSALRLYVSRIRNEIQTSKRKRKSPHINLPAVDDQSAWIKFCTDSKANGSQSKDSHRPTLGLILSMRQCVVEQVLEYLAEQIEQDKNIGDLSGQWIYALLAVLEQPLDPDMCSCLRTLARACSVIRANLGTDDTKQVASLNLFICLVARYFRQTDLADP